MNAGTCLAGGGARHDTLMSMERLPPLELTTPTRDLVHGYCRLLGAVRRKLVEPHPMWWHISLAVTGDGFTTGPVPDPEGNTLEVLFSADRALIEIARGGRSELIPVAEGPAPRDVGAALVQAGLLSSHEIDDLLAEGPEPVPGTFHRPTAERLAAAFDVVRRFYERFAPPLGDIGPTQLWPHHFDLSFEWFGKRRAEASDGSSSRTQIGFGFSTGDPSHSESYFYANPWPFGPRLVAHGLSPPAVWNTGDWNGGLLDYSAVQEAGLGLLETFCREVFELASPDL